MPPTDALAGHLAPRLDHETIAAGLATLAATADHRVRVHAGPPARCQCQHHRSTYTRGEIDVFPAGISDAWHQSDVSSALIVQITPTLVRRAAEDLGLDPDRAELPPRHQFRDPQIEHIAWALEAERVAGSPCGPVFAETLGLALAVRLLGPLAAPLPRPPRGLTAQQLRRVTDYIEDNLDRDLSLATIADIAGISASHLKTLFRRSLGQPVHTYVIHRRVERARALLLRGRMPASEVALAAGFSHQSHMTRCMRRVLGVTPSTLTRTTND
ncbi:AraC family transcriptional regulator [Nannocystis radixulma]|uniref:AraC family transcriptional regulator n=1 Tax=Nannocystis radixulma TaxID=2995305 RepID=A0ABT5AYH6_9BACT|nr:AraC family transcriptional regulator [Nannocystis radixulma]MDC0666505.1 AraC family transcriptional regulator [Nannocystis radixulma]